MYTYTYSSISSYSLTDSHSNSSYYAHLHNARTTGAEKAIKFLKFLKAPPNVRKYRENVEVFHEILEDYLSLVKEMVKFAKEEVGRTSKVMAVLRSKKDSHTKKLKVFEERMKSKQDDITRMLELVDYDKKVWKEMFGSTPKVTWERLLGLMWERIVSKRRPFEEFRKYVETLYVPPDKSRVDEGDWNIMIAKIREKYKGVSLFSHTYCVTLKDGEDPVRGSAMELILIHSVRVVLTLLCRNSLEHKNIKHCGKT